MEIIKPSDLKNNGLTILGQVLNDKKTFKIMNERLEIAILVPVSAIDDAIKEAIAKDRLSRKKPKKTD